MTTVNTSQNNLTETIITVDEVNRVLVLGRLLLSVLTPEEREELQEQIAGEVISKCISPKKPIGNMGVT